MPFLDPEGIVVIDTASREDWAGMLASPIYVSNGHAIIFVGTVFTGARYWILNFRYDYLSGQIIGLSGLPFLDIPGSQLANHTNFERVFHFPSENVFVLWAQRTRVTADTEGNHCYLRRFSYSSAGVVAAGPLVDIITDETGEEHYVDCPTSTSANVMADLRLTTPDIRRVIAVRYANLVSGAVSDSVIAEPTEFIPGGTETSFSRLHVFTNGSGSTSRYLLQAEEDDVEYWFDGNFTGDGITTPNLVATQTQIPDEYVYTALRGLWAEGAGETAGQSDADYWDGEGDNWEMTSSGPSALPLISFETSLDEFPASAGGPAVTPLWNGEIEIHITRGFGPSADSLGRRYTYPGLEPGRAFWRANLSGADIGSPITPTPAYWLYWGSDPYQLLRFDDFVPESTSGWALGWHS